MHILFIVVGIYHTEIDTHTRMIVLRIKERDTWNITIVHCTITLVSFPIPVYPHRENYGRQNPNFI